MSIGREARFGHERKNLAPVTVDMEAQEVHPLCGIQRSAQETGEENGFGIETGQNRFDLVEKSLSELQVPQPSRIRGPPVWGVAMGGALLSVSRCQR